MSHPAYGNRPINSTFAPVNNPSTTILLAELESTNFGIDLTHPIQQSRTYTVSIYLGGSTGGYWAVEQATSTAISAGAVVDAFYPRTASGQTSQFVRKYVLAPTDRIRVRHVSSVTGLFEASLQAEEWT